MKPYGELQVVIVSDDMAVMGRGLIKRGFYLKFLRSDF
jgi:hypothetical protein